MIRQVFLFALCVGFAGSFVSPAHSESTAHPVLQFQFDQIMSAKMTEVCEGLSPNPNGVAAQKALLAADLAADEADLDDALATAPSAEDLFPFYEAFIARHGGAVFSSRSSFCRAGLREIEEKTALGQTLRASDR